MEIYGDAMMASIIKKPVDSQEPGVEEVASGQQAIEESIAALKRHEEMIEQRRMRERSRFSEPRSTQTADGTEWSYVLVDGEYLRLIECKAECETLVIPAELDGLSVLELGSQACANLISVREIICAEDIEFIGVNAFRSCGNLTRIVFPHNITRFDATWLAQCNKLREVIMPAMLKSFDASVFNAENIEVLTLGVATQDVDPGAFAKSRLKELRIPAQNPYLITDGRSILSRDGAELIAVAVPCTSFEIPQGCTHVASKAFAACPQLDEIVFPDTLKTIGTHAFARTALQALALPDSVAHIERRAFYRCRKLADLQLNEGLLSIGEEAFAGTALEKLQLPASLEDLSRTAFSETSLSFAAGRGSCSIAEGGKLRFDRHAVLYRDESECMDKELICIMGPDPERYCIEQGTRAIGPDAFARCNNLRKLVMCEGLVTIGKGAFRSCKNLTHAQFPESLRSIDDEAFLDTSIEEIYIPAQLSHIGTSALVSASAHEGEMLSNLRSIRVSPNSSRFYFTGGLLCERLNGGSARVVLFDDAHEVVHVPHEVTEICPYAFSNAQNLRELYLSTRITRIGVRALNIACLVEHVHVDMEEEIDGHSEIDLHFPHTLRSIRELTRGLNTSPSIDPEKIMARYDACVVNMHDYDAKNSDPIDLYGQVTRIIGRLLDPIFLSETTHNMYLRIIQDNLEDMCVAIARHDDRESIDALIDLGFLNRETILRVIDCVGRLQDAAMTGYLLEAKRVLFSSGTIDFDL